MNAASSSSSSSSSSVTRPGGLSPQVLGCICIAGVTIVLLLGTLMSSSCEVCDECEVCESPPEGIYVERIEKCTRYVIDDTGARTCVEATEIDIVVPPDNPGCDAAVVWNSDVESWKCDGDCVAGYVQGDGGLCVPLPPGCLCDE